MQGLFEIHVSVSTNKSQVHKFRLWCLDNDVKAIGISGMVPEVTFSKYTNGTSEKAYDKAMSLARNLQINGIEVDRVRIEAIFSKQDSMIDDYISKSTQSGYFEFHLKYHIINSKDYLELERISDELNTQEDLVNGKFYFYSFVGFNFFKKNVEPIITLRVFCKTTAEGIYYKDLLINKLKNRGFRTNEEIHMEYVFYDQKFSKL